MNVLNLAGDSDPDRPPRWLPAIAGLLVAGIIAFLMGRLPLTHSLSWSELIGSAVVRVLAVFLASAVTVWAFCVIALKTSGTNKRRLIVRTSLDALWLAPLALFTSENSAWTMAIAALLVASVTKSFRLLHDHSEGNDTEGSLVASLNSKMFSLPDSSLGFWRLLLSVCAALCAQTGALADSTGYPFSAATLVGISSAIWTWSFTTDARPGQFSAFSKPTLRMLLIAAMAIVFTVAGLMRYLEKTYLSGGLGVPSRNHSRHGFARTERHGQTDREKTSEGSLAAVSEAYHGIVLWPKEQTYTKLVAPSPAIGNSLLRNNRSAKPLIIPFNGVYWFFKAPDVEPPRGSREAHGSPEKLDIRSTDRHPLSMEAHQNFGNMIDLDCCSRIQVAIRNADRYPETVSLELTLINTSLPGKPSQSLGRIVVNSTRPWKLYDDRPPTTEVLTFGIPANPAIHRFDEVMIVFRLDAERSDAGAKIAIERFVLVPWGL